MSYITSLVLKDAANADVTFARESGDPKGVTLRKTGTSFRDSHRVSLTSVTPTQNGQVVRVQFEITVPVYRTVDNVNTLDYTMRARGEVLIPVGATDSERDLLAAYTGSLVSGVPFKNIIQELDLPQ